ncbi:MAG TPA: HDIG domain-containing protein [Thermoleophilaceae bacterium]|nr:HDIG domain-containing protein [Thermoleophilaceae bacterium]
MTALDDSPAVQAVRAALAGERAWIVGGTVRDARLGRPLRDVDLATTSDPRSLAHAVARAAGGAAFSLSDEFGAWRAVNRDEGWVCDVSPLQGATIEEDLAARDFTVNAMAVPLAGGEALDPLGGAADLEAGRLRVVAAGVYEADPLRVLRLARFAAELGFRPDEETERLTAEAAPLLDRPAGERVFAELRRLVTAPGVLDGLRLADRLGILRAVLPELSAMHDVEQSPYHHRDAYGHTIEVLERLLELERELEEAFGDAAPALQGLLAEPLADELTRGGALRFGALFHDVGKPDTRRVQDDGRITFMGHDKLGGEMVTGICARLRTSTRLRDHLVALTRHHLRLGFLVHRRPLGRREVYSYLRACEPVEVDVSLLSCADRLATRGKNHEQAIERHFDLARELIGEALAWRGRAPEEPLVRGADLAHELGLEPGPEIGRLLALVEEARFAGEVATREEALEVARRNRL